jgi:hypothetical protein
MNLPNGHRAIVDIEKLRDYCLDPNHPRGRNKARVFAAHGVHSRDAEELRQALLWAAVNAEASVGMVNLYGQRYIIDFPWTRGERVVNVRSSWIVLVGQDDPRLTSCYVL